jgi:proline iminopeptidase
MKFTLFILLILTLPTLVAGQEIYVRTFGKSTDRPVIYLHGGPGYNCVNFEITSAQKLADKGFFVIVYDRSGEGRSTSVNALFTFNDSFATINKIYTDYGLKQATLLGHSFGGILATLFAEKFPEKIQSVILLGAPVSLQESFKTIIRTSKSIYEKNNDQVSLNYIKLLENMDPKSLEYSSYCFGHAMKNGFYSPKNPTPEAKELYSLFGTDETLKKYAASMSYEGPQGFWKNESYTTIDLTANIQTLLVKKIKVYALYGKQDGLYSPEQITTLQAQIGKDNLQYLDNCSHNVFIDQQVIFLEALIRWIN